MGATRFHDRKEVTDDCHVFFKKTGGILYYKKLEELGFEVSNFSGHFMSSEVSRLVDFCRKHPRYHIITMTHIGIFENHYVPDKKVYLLADGDSNPSLALHVFLKKNSDLFLEEGFAKALAIISQIDGCGEGE